MMIQKDIEQHKNTEIRERRQCVAAIIINVSSIGGGMMVGWMSPTIPELLSDNPPFGTEPFNEDQISWLSSIITIAPLLATPLAGWVSERFGRKITGCCIAIPMISSWLLILFAQTYYHLLIARFLVGTASGLALSTVPVYVAEISSKTIRGTLGCYLGLGLNLGILIGFVLGTVFSYHLFAICGLMVPLVFLLSFIFMPETPIYLIRKGRIDEGIRSLNWLNNGDKSAVDRELFHLQQQCDNMPNSKQSVSLKDLFRDRGTIKGFIISLYVLIGRQTSGHGIVFSYSTIIFKSSKSLLDPHNASIVLAVIQIIGSFLSTLTIERFGRRSLILISCGTMMACHLTFGIFFLLQDKTYDLSSFSWLPIVALSSYALAYSVGIGAAAFVVASEVLRPDIVSLGTSISLAVDNIMSSVIMKFFPFLSSTFGNDTSFFILSSFCACTFILTYFLLPETKGRSRESIFRELNGETSAEANSACRNR